MPATRARRTFPDEIVELLRDRILRGQYKADDRLPPERDLAITLGTNRNTLREALRSLEAQGLVRARQGDGVRVLDFRAEGELGLLPHYLRAAEINDLLRIVADMLRLRTMLATELVSLAARSGKVERRTALTPKLRQLEKAATSGQMQKVLDAELDLYRAIVLVSDSLMHLWMFNTLENILRTMFDAYPQIFVTPTNYLTCWQRLTKAIQARDPDAAEQVIDALYGETDRAIYEMLGFSNPSRKARSR